MYVSLSYINGVIGVSLEADQVISLLNKMQLSAKHLTLKDGSCAFSVSVPPTRSGVIHARDVMEDCFAANDVEIVHTSIIPGLLKTIGHHKDHQKQVKIFEVGDIALLDEEKDVGARNHRRLAALYCNSHSGFEVIFEFHTTDGQVGHRSSDLLKLKSADSGALVMLSNGFR